MIDWTKPVETTDGRPVRVLCTDKVCGMPIVCLVKILDDEERIYLATRDGELSDTCLFELRNVTPIQWEDPAR